MFIILSYDNTIMEMARELKKLYPNEAAVRIKNIASSKFTELDGSSPTRLSYCGHGGYPNDSREQNTYAGYSPEDFANKVVKDLLSGAKINPALKKTLTTVDLFGCMVGCNNGSDEVFTAKVGRLVNEKLTKEGFNPIEFKAITNKILSPDNKCHAVIVYVPEIVGNKQLDFNMTGYTTKNDLEEALEIKKVMARLHEIKQAATANKEGNGLSIEQELDAICVGKRSKRSKDPYIDMANESLEFFKAYNSPEVDKIVNRIEVLKERHSVIKQIDKENNELYKQLRQHEINICSFKDPRELVDKHSVCNFTSQASKSSQFKSKYEQTKKADETPSSTTRIRLG